MDISKISLPIKGKRPKRCGRGPGSGLGKTSGRGHKGAGQRSGKKLPYIGFSGGNIPYLRKLPKRGFNSYPDKEFQIVNLRDIASRFKEQEEINPLVLKRRGLIKDEDKPVKILAGIKDKFSLKALFKADKFSKKAERLILEAGGKTELIQR